MKAKKDVTTNNSRLTREEKDPRPFVLYGQNECHHGCGVLVNLYNVPVANCYYYNRPPRQRVATFNSQPGG